MFPEIMIVLLNSVISVIVESTDRVNTVATDCPSFSWVPVASHVILMYEPASVGVQLLTVKSSVMVSVPVYFK